jgi:predicted peptidase
MKASIRWLVLGLAASAFGADDKSTAEYEEHTFSVRGGPKLPYRLLKPAKVEAGEKYPLVLVLHGFGERGQDNQKQLKDYGPFFLKPNLRKRFPCFVLMPQCPDTWIFNADFDNSIRLSKTPTATLAMTNELLKTLLKKFPVDPDRLYLTGYSNGACAVWELLEREPRVWAAAVPSAGAGSPQHIGGAKDVAIWAFHGDKDKTIPVARMNEMIAALHAAHGHPMYTIVPGGAHYDAKSHALEDPNLLPWMFAQVRGKPAVPFDQVAKPKDKRPTSLEKKK